VLLYESLLTLSQLPRIVTPQLLCCPQLTSVQDHLDLVLPGSS